jgi:hypothetical protein
VRGQHVHLAPDAELVERVDAHLHGVEVGVGTHQNGNKWFGHGSININSGFHKI